MLAVSTESVISRDYIPSGKQVREFAPPYEASDTEAAEQCFAYCISSILPGEEMMLAISTGSVIRTNNIPSGKQVRECGVRVKS